MQNVFKHWGTERKGGLFWYSIGMAAVEHLSKKVTNWLLHIIRHNKKVVCILYVYFWR